MLSASRTRHGAFVHVILSSLSDADRCLQYGVESRMVPTSHNSGLTVAQRLSSARPVPGWHVSCWSTLHVAKPSDKDRKTGIAKG